MRSADIIPGTYIPNAKAAIKWGKKTLSSNMPEKPVIRSKKRSSFLYRLFTNTTMKPSAVKSDTAITNCLVVTRYGILSGLFLIQSSIEIASSILCSMRANGRTAIALFKFFSTMLILWILQSFHFQNSPSML